MNEILDQDDQSPCKCQQIFMRCFCKQKKEYTFLELFDLIKSKYSTSELLTNDTLWTLYNHLEFYVRTGNGDKIPSKDGTFSNLIEKYLGVKL